MHMLGGAEDGVNRAGWDALSAAYTRSFIDFGDQSGTFHTKLWRQWFGSHAQ